MLYEAYRTLLFFVRTIPQGKMAFSFKKWMGYHISFEQCICPQLVEIKRLPWTIRLYVGCLREIGIRRGYASTIIRVEHLLRPQRVIKRMILLLIPNKLIEILLRKYIPVVCGEICM